MSFTAAPLLTKLRVVRQTDSECISSINMRNNLPNQLLNLVFPAKVVVVLHRVLATVVENDWVVSDFELGPLKHEILLELAEDFLHV